MSQKQNVFVEFLGLFVKIEKQYVYLSQIGFALQFDHNIFSVMLLLQYSAQIPFKLDSIHNFENKAIVKCKRISWCC